MKFLFFAATALAATATKRQSGDLSTVESALAAISSGTASLDSGIKSFSGLADAGSLESQASGLVTTINNANSQISAIGQLDSSAATLATPLQSLAALVSTTVDDLIAKKSTFDSAGVSGVVEDAAKQLQTAAQTLITTTIGKVPDSLKSLGQQLSQPIIDSLNRAVTAFAGSSSGGSSSSSATSASASSAPSSTTGSSAPTSTTSGAASYTTTSAAASTTKASATSSSSSVATYTGAAIANAVNGYGAVAMAVLAGAAML